jgi:hypothetical protein
VQKIYVDKKWDKITRETIIFVHKVQKLHLLGIILPDIMRKGNTSRNSSQPEMKEEFITTLNNFSD